MPKTKNNYFRFLFFVSFFIFSSAAVNAQGSLRNDYTVLQSLGAPYVDLVGGKSMPFAASPDGLGLSPLAPFGHTSQLNFSVPIGFNFVFNNASYSTVNINDNGFISFGATSPGTVVTPISATTAYNGAISGCGFPLAGNVFSAASSAASNTYNPDGADIQYLTDTSGGLGNYVFIVEYKNMKRRTGGTTNHDGLLNFQIRLYESNMRIEIQYKAFTSLSTSPLNVQVGLRGLTNTDFSNRGVASWVGTTIGTANTTSLPTSNTIGPAANTQFTWTPTCFNPTALVTNLQVDNTTVNFSWTAPAYLTATFANYNWEVRTSGAAGSGAVGLFLSGTIALTNASVTGLLPGIPYYFYVKSSCKPWTSLQSTAGAVSTGTTITVNSTVGLSVGMSVLSTAGIGVFAPGTTIASITSATQFVVSIAPTTALSGGASVTTSTIGISGTLTPTCSTPVFPYVETFEGVVAPVLPNCTSTAITTGTLPMRTRDAASAIPFPVTTGPYGGFTNKNLITANAALQNTWFFSRLISLTAGTTYRVSYKYGGSREAAAYSQNLRVAIGLANTAAGMTVLLADHQNIKTTPNTFTFHFVAPGTGSYYLGFNGFANATNGYLQIDDISLNTPTCAPPTGFTTGAISFNSAVVSWTPPAPAPAAGYEYIISTVNTTPISTTTISGANLGTVTTFTGLLSSTPYYVWVRSNCAGEYSAWSPVTTFTTTAPPPAPCTPAPTSVDGTGITNVTIGSINNTTGAEPGRYGDYSALVTNIAQNTTVPVILRYSTAGFAYFTKIWIDFNDNGSFADAGEIVYNSGALELPSGVNNISFFVPLAAPLGQHRMRIGGSDTNNLNGFGVGQGPCYNGVWGTFEDYSVFVTSPPPPLILSSSSSSFCNGGTSPLVTLNFNAHSGAPAVRYDNFVWNPNAGVVGTPTGGYSFSPTNPGINVYTLTATQATFPFISNTVTYTVTVNDTPTPIVFTPATLTVCEGIPTALTSGGGIVTGALIFEDNFNGSDVFTRVQQLIPPVLPTDPPLVPYGPWIAVNNSVGGTNIPPGSAAAWTLRNSPYVYGGNTFVSNDSSQFFMSNSDAQGNGGGSTTNTELISPLMSFVGYTNVSLSYWQHYRNFPTGVIETQIWNDADNSGTVNGSETLSTVQTFSTVGSGAASNFANITIDLTPFAGQDDLRLRFKYSNATWAWWWAIDNVKITGSGPASLSWAPTTGLYTSPLATPGTEYVGGPATVVYAKLTSNATYTATAAALSPPFCSTSSVLNIIITKAGTAAGNQVLACGDTTLSSNITLTGYVPLLPGTITGWQMADNPAFTSATTVPGSAGKNILTPADVSGLSTTTYFRAMILGCPTLFSNTITVSYPTKTWTGVWTPPGLPGVTDNVTVASGTLTIAADLSICSLRVQNNATVTVNPGVTLTVNGNVIIAGGFPGGTLNFLDDNTFTLGAASLMQNPAAAVNANTGVAKYERWTKTRKFDYTYWSSPLNPNNLITVSEFTLADKFLKFDSNAYVWTYLNPVATTMTPGVGYAIRGPQSGSGSSETVLQNFKGNFKGTPNNGNYDVRLYRNIPANDRNLIGNPYPSAIDADLLMDGNPGVLGPAGVGTTFYFWTHNTQYVGGSYLESDFAVYNRTGGVGTIAAPSPGDNTNVPNGIIPAGQGFIVKAVTVTPVTGSLMTFRNDMRVAGNNNRFYRHSNSTNKSRIWLDYTNLNSVEEFKQLLVGYIPNATNGYEDGFDGEVIETGGSIGFYSVADQDNKHLVIQGRALPFSNSDVVSLGYKASAASTYQIAMSNHDGLFEDNLVGIYLEDTLLGVIHDLRQAPYQFVTEAGTFDTRFVLRYNNGFLAVNPNNFNENNVVVFKQSEQIHVETSVVKMKSVQIFDLQGRLVMAKNDINSQSATLQKVGLANQVLMVQITSVDGVIVNKKIIF